MPFPEAGAGSTRGRRAGDGAGEPRKGDDETVNEVERADVVILGGGLAGLSLARHLLLETERTVVLVERREELPPKRQKVGESLVQLAGYYFSKVLDLEEHLLRKHYMKYNLRFYWKSPGRQNTRFEEYSQSYIREISNVASYQLDRNELERELLRRNLESPRFVFLPGVRDLQVDLAEGGLRHRVVLNDGVSRREVSAEWVVDTTGRNRFLARRRDMARPSEIHHGAFFWWVDGLLDVDKLTDRSPRDVRLKPQRRHQGHLPLWLATNHFCGEGHWFWVIPLQGKTSLGLVFDNRVIDPSDVLSVEKARDWVCREHPLFARDLPHRRVLDSAGFRSFAHDCVQTISPDRWAISGEAGRFSDPLYSPGSDLIALYNTLIVAAIEAGDRAELEARCRLAEQLMRALYAAYVPSYAVSYDALGDQETFSLKYTWELAVYFALYVFPFINDLFTDRRFSVAFLRHFAQLGPLNHSVQQLLSDYFQWKKEHHPPPEGPVFFDFTEIGPLQAAAQTFYEVGLSVDEARRVLTRQVENLGELCRFLAAHVASVVLEEPRVVSSRAFVEDLHPETIQFEPEAWRRRWAECAGDRETWRWSFAPGVLRRFRTGQADRSFDSEREQAAGPPARSGDRR